VSLAAGRRPLIAGNWKMHKTAAEARELVQELLAEPLEDGVDIVIAPPFTALWAVHDELREHEKTIALAAQTMHESDHGPATGEISGVMLREIGVEYVILGHSERRAECGETDAGVNRKVRAALAHGLTPIVAVGESADEHARAETVAIVTGQTRAAFADVSAADVARCVVAYEPIWAIGTGLVDHPANANAVIGAIRNCVAGLADARLLYGGSMKSENAAALMAQPEIDGGLVGGASLNAASFLGIVRSARVRAQAL
jgi:triosephosphate isomerase